jgi:hypothetical protein
MLDGTIRPRKGIEAADEKAPLANGRAGLLLIYRSIWSSRI